jgi:acetolactate synthase I/II/III large subunit
MNAAAPLTRNGGQILVDALKAHLVDTAFCVPGESFLPILDALHDARDSVRLVVGRHEATTSHMTEAYAKLTGKPGICLVTRGPGATQASIGVHTAAQDSTPMVLLVGQVNSKYMGREAWQEIDVAHMFGAMAKWSTQVNSIYDIPAVMRKAFHIATSGRPGPVVVAIPEDILYQQAVLPDVPPQGREEVLPTAAKLHKLHTMLSSAARPLVILGGGGWTQAAWHDLRMFTERFDLPVCTSFRRQDLFDNLHPLYAGPLGIGVGDKLAQRVRDADLILAVGTRLNETTTSEYQLLRAPRPQQTLIHVHSGREELGRVYQADLTIHADMPAFAHALGQLAAPTQCAWKGQAAQAHADYLSTLAPAFTSVLPPSASPTPETTLTLTAGPNAALEDSFVNMAEVITWLRTRLPTDSILTNGAGNYTSWVHRYYAHRTLHTQLAPISGAMGYGVPSAIAAKLAYPERTVVCFAGDGCFSMSSHELATARQYGLAIIFIVVNNGIYGSIRMHQEINFPGKVYATDITNPDFAPLARAHGLQGARIDHSADFPAAFERALLSSTGALIELRTDPEIITPRTTLTLLRKRAVAQ